jgi:hypothetical protein
MLGNNVEEEEDMEGEGGRGKVEDRGLLFWSENDIYSSPLFLKMIFFPLS